MSKYYKSNIDASNNGIVTFGYENIINGFANSSHVYSGNRYEPQQKLNSKKFVNSDKKFGYIYKKVCYIFLNV